jgi:hypothetical protein
MSKRLALTAGLILMVVTGGISAGRTLMRGGEESSSPPETRERDRTTPSPAGSEASGPIRFVLGERYRAGETIEVVIENVGRKAYVFEFYYQACFLSFFDSSGRRFIVPPGTHCDLRAKEPIRPGERKKLFRWRLDECVKDEWGCVESRPLPPGVYTIKGRFKPKGGGTPARVEARFRIV